MLKLKNIKKFIYLITIPSVLLLEPKSSNPPSVPPKANNKGCNGKYYIRN